LAVTKIPEIDPANYISLQNILSPPMSSSLYPHLMLYDASHWGRLEITDTDRLSFLHNQSTNGFKLRQPGEGADTVFLTSTARTLDLATAYVLPESVLLTLSPGMIEPVMAFLDRYIFFADKVKLTDVTAQTTMLRLIGPDSDRAITQLGAASLVGQPESTHQIVPIGGHEVRVTVGCGLALPGYTLIAAVNAATDLRMSLEAIDAAPIDEATWQTHRVQQGRPMPGQELTEDYNPLEAGLWHLISFNKGCYIGQETIARLDTYNGVKQQLWGFQVAAPVSLGDPVMVGEEKVGKVTSLVPIGDGYIGLAYVRSKAGGEGLGVSIGGQTTQLQDLPFSHREKSQ
jgi:tRNA-modifying protein YgfZ